MEWTGIDETSAGPTGLEIIHCLHELVFNTLEGLGFDELRTKSACLPVEVGEHVAFE